MHRFTYKGILFLLMSTIMGALNFVYAKETYLVGIEDLNYYPLIASADTYPDKGLLVTILEDFGKVHDVNFVYVPLPITRFHLWYEKDDIDFRLPDNAYWNDSSEGLIFSDSIVNIKSTTVVLKQREEWPLERFEHIGILFGFTPSAHWKQLINAKKLTVVSDSSMLILVRMLHKDVVHGLDLDMSTVSYYSNILGYDTNQLAYAVKTGSPEAR